MTTYLTPDEFATRLRVSLRTVRSMISAGVIRVTRVGRLVRIPMSSVEQYERTHTN